MVDSQQSPIVINGTISRPDPWKYSSLVSQTDASGSITFGGSYANGDVITLTFTSKQFSTGTYALSVTAGGSETPTTIATAFKNLINADGLLKSLGVTATSSGSVVTTKWSGPLGNFGTIAFSKSAGSGSATIVQTKGGAGYITPQQNARYMNNGIICTLDYGQPVMVDYSQLKSILDAGITVK